MPPATPKDQTPPLTPGSFIEKLSAADLHVLGQFINEQVTARLGVGGTDQHGVLSKISDSQAALTKLVGEMQRATNKENPNYEDRSVYNFDPACPSCKARERHPTENGEPGKFGHPKPKLKHETFFCGGIQREDWLTPMEIDLFNQFEKSTTAREGRWTATLSRDGTRKVLHIALPYRGADVRAELPPLTTILLELIYGPAIADPMQQLQMITDMQKQIAALEAKLAAPAA
jgi:hypothetical protein